LGQLGLDTPESDEYDHPFAKFNPYNMMEPADSDNHPDPYPDPYSDPYSDPEHHVWTKPSDADMFADKIMAEISAEPYELVSPELLTSIAEIPVMLPETDVAQMISSDDRMDSPVATASIASSVSLAEYAGDAWL
jgi:hypothetical protein